MNKPELTAEEIERLRQYHYSTGPMNIPLGIDKLCDMALRATELEWKLHAVSLSDEEAADAAALPEDLARLVRELRTGPILFELRRKAADTIEALNAARVKAEGGRDSFRRDLIIEKSHSDAEYRKREAAEAREAALVNALEEMVEAAFEVGVGEGDGVFNGYVWKRAREALRTARDAAISPDEGNREVIKGEVGRELDGWGAPDAPPIDPVTVAEVLEVLEPFADAASKWADDGIDWEINDYGDFNTGHLRRAAALRDKLTKGRAALGEPE